MSDSAPTGKSGPQPPQPPEPRGTDTVLGAARGVREQGSSLSRLAQSDRQAQTGQPGRTRLPEAAARHSAAKNSAAQASQTPSVAEPPVAPRSASKPAAIEPPLLDTIPGAEPAPELVQERAPQLDATAALLPFAFARKFGVLLTSEILADGRSVVAFKVQPSVTTLTELKRYSGKGLALRHVGDAEFEELLSSVYSRDSSAACLLYTSPSPRDATLSRMPSSA